MEKATNFRQYGKTKRADFLDIAQGKYCPLITSNRSSVLPFSLFVLPCSFGIGIKLPIFSFGDEDGIIYRYTFSC